MGHAHFSNNKVCIFCEPDRPTSVFFSCEMAVDMARNAWFEVCGVAPHGFQPRKEIRFQEKAYLCISIIQALYSRYFSYIGCFHQLMVCS